MANTILHKRSSTPAAIPAPGSLTPGELAVNTADGKLFMKKDDTSIIEVGGASIAAIIEDTNPTLGGNLATGGFDINIGAGDRIVLSDGDAIAPSLAFSSKTDAGLYYASGEIRLGYNGTTVAQITDVDFTVLPNITVTAATPSADNHLTRKDYVDTYVQSRGENLITNGTGLFEDVTNFPGFVYDTSESVVGSGAFAVTSTNTGRILGEMIPVDHNKTYRFEATMKEKTPGDGPETPNFYMLLKSYDSDKLTILPNYIMYFSGTETTLAADLNNNDTTIVLTDSANWHDLASASTWDRAISIYGYTNSVGHVYADYTYTRHNFWDIYAGGGSINYSTHTITLSAPWSGGSFSAGTAVTNATSGAGHVYPVVNASTPADWTVFGGRVGGLQQNGVSSENKFRHGTAFVQPGWFINRDTTNPVTTLVDSVSFGLDIVNHDTVNAEINTTVALDGTRSMTGQLAISYDVGLNDSMLRLDESQNGNEINFRPELVSGSYNPGVQTGDFGMIFSDAGVDSATFFLGSQSTVAFGIRMDTPALTMDMYGQVVHNSTVSFGSEIANTGTSFDWTAGNKQKYTRTTNATITFTNPPGPCNLTLKMIITGGVTLTWPASVKWPAGTQPAWTSGGTDILSFYYDGTNYHGMVGLAFA